MISINHNKLDQKLLSLINQMRLPKEIMNNKIILDELIYKMRFQNINPIKGDNKACMTYKSISNIVNKS